MTKSVGHVVLVLAFSWALLATSVLVQGPALSQTETQEPAAVISGNPPGRSQDTAVEHGRELKRLHERVATIGAQLKGSREAITALIQATDNYATYLTLFGRAISLVFTALGSVGAYWVKARLAEIEKIEREVEQIVEQTSSTVAVRQGGSGTATKQRRGEGSRP